MMSNEVIVSNFKALDNSQKALLKRVDEVSNQNKQLEINLVMMSQKLAALETKYTVVMSRI